MGWPRWRTEARVLERGLEPIDAYDRIAASYAEISERRRAYLRGVERLVISLIPAGSAAMLDVGAGDGTRSARIAEACGIKELVLLEPSARMLSDPPAGATVWAIRAEELAAKEGEFDVVVCLWNVLGRVFPRASRVEALRQCGRLLSSTGLLFIDVNHRYNARAYGAMRTLGRFLHDLVRPGEANGDVTAAWDVDGTKYTTRGHVFTDREFRGLVLDAGLTVRRRFAVDYGSGEIVRSPFRGSLLYVLDRDA